MLKKEEERQEVMDDEVKDRSSPHRDACYCLEVVKIVVCVRVKRKDIGSALAIVSEGSMCERSPQSIICVIWR
jgi:hypothetical protein